MDVISQREMRNNSGEVLRRVAAGETFLVTNGGKPAALLSPVADVSRLERLIATGRVRPAKRQSDVEALRQVPSTMTVEQLLDEDRGER